MLKLKIGDHLRWKDRNGEWVKLFITEIRIGRENCDELSDGLIVCGQIDMEGEEISGDIEISYIDSEYSIYSQSLSTCRCNDKREI